MAAAADINKNPDGGAPSVAGPLAEPLFQRRIEFHAATKPYSPVSSSGGDFRLETLNPSSGSNKPAALGSAAREAAPASGKRSEGGEFIEHGLDPELGFRITFRRIGAGLANLGNTCFLNSVLQCLTYTEPFAAYLQSGKHKSSCRTAGFCALCALQNHVMIALQSTGKILSPSHLVRNLRCISRNFRNSRQEDAHEYMVNLLESMHKCCLPSGVPSESPSAYEKSLVHKIFGGRLRSQVKCTQCSFCSNKFDPFLDLSLEIVKADSLNKALGHFTAMEQLDGGEKQYQCQRCKEKVRALKQLTIHKAPYVLTIHLKRFGPDVPGQKIDRKVEFGPTLDLKPFVSDPHESNLRYTLYGVLVHAGWSTHSGHYYCFVRTSSGMWHSLDDNRVLQVSEKTVLAQKAYMLFYVRDRGTSIKRSVDVARKENIFANVPGNQVIPRSASISNGAIQYNVIERKVISECSSAKSKTDDSSRGQSVSVIGTSTEYSVRKEASFLQKNENSMLKEAPLLQDNGHATPKEASCMRTNETVLLNDSKSFPTENLLEKRPLSATLTVLEDFVKPSQLTERNVASMSCAKDSLTPESTQIPNGKSQPVNGCTGKVESGVHVNENNGPLKLTSKNHTDELIEETNKGEIGSLTKGIPQNIDIPCTVNPVCLPNKNGPAQLVSQSNHMNGFIQKEAFAKKLVENQSIAWEDDKSLRNLQRPNSVDSMQETGLGNLSKMSQTANGSVQKEALAVTETETSAASHSYAEHKPKGIPNYSRAERKPKGIPKSLANGLFFGGKHLFLMSLHLRKKQKSKRSKKCYLNSKNTVKSKVLEDLNINERAASTSEPIKIVGSDSIHSPKKRSRLSSNKEHNSGEVKDGGRCNGDFVHNNCRDTERAANTGVMLSTSEQSKRMFSSVLKQCNARESDLNGRGLIQNGLSSLLLSKETAVPQWDDTELPSSLIHGLGDAQNNTIGYVLDEWDEEYDRGKRKKVKQSKFSFDGPNPFQETANFRIRHKKMKVDRTSSGNHPLRI